MRTCVFAAALAAGAATGARPLPLSSAPLLSAPLTCGASGPAYSVSLDGAALLTSPPALRAHVGGAWQTSWTLVGGAPEVGSDSLGAYAGTSCSYVASDGTPLTLGAFAYASAGAAPRVSLVRFTLAWPSGAAGTNHSVLPSGATQSTIANFPGFAGAAAPLPHIQTWNDAFFAPSQSMPDVYGQRGGPIVWYGADVAGAVVILSPLDQFLTSSLGDALSASDSCASAAGGSVGCWTAGTSAAVTSLPPGHSHSWVLVAGGAGITDTAAAWGSVLRAQYGATADAKLADGTLTTLGYQTDNGAQLCFGCPGQVLDACLLAEKASLDALRVPIQYLSFQNAWWKSGGESAPWCVGEWEAVPAKVPMGIPAFQQALALPLQLYAPYFCATSSYVQNFTMVRSDPTLPGCNDFDFYDAAPDSSRLFYDFLFELGQSYGMQWFEPDFLNANHLCVPDFIENVGAADAFFDGQASAALARGIPIQWCFATPYVLMWTLGAPAITNFRVSYDFFYGSSWDIGRSSLLVWAMGGKPSKDTFWTTDNGNQSTTRGGCDKKGCPPDHSAAGAVLHTMLTTLSTGPVGFSDAPGETDAVLLSRTCDANGTLLQPSRPLTAVDSTWEPDAAHAPSGGYVLGTHSAIDGLVVGHAFVSHQLTAPFTLRALDAWPRLTPGASIVIADWMRVLACADTGAASSPAAGCGATAATVPADATGALATLPAKPAAGDAYTVTLTLALPSCAAPAPALTFIGEVDKFATLAAWRFASFACSPAGIAVAVQGLPGETVRLAWVYGGGATLGFGNVTFAAAADVGRSTRTCTISAGGALAC